ncbi:MAG TPA: ATP-binding protein [Nitrososphaeria archaeon]|jgi:AAA+ ATPase superfamily predicted ATPase|nr:ATP-binding protein [Nitrososphaeria archaeon]
MLFDPRPKASRDELFDREKELGILDGSVGKPLIVVAGIRRVGKSSLLMSFLENRRGVYVDLREVRTRADLYRKISDGLSSSLRRLGEGFLRQIRGVRVMGLEVELKWRGADSISISGLMEELSMRGRTIFVFDEVQGLRPPLSLELRNAISYVYDNVPNSTVVLSGSEVGLLHDFVGVDNPESPLFGRYYTEVHVERFPRSKSMEFLERGFSEAGRSVGGDALERGVELFDGIPGWLVYYGMAVIDGRDMDEVTESAISLARAEMGKLSDRERYVAKAVAGGARSWAEVRRAVEESSGTVIPKSALTRAVRRLEKLSVIQDYRFLDPVYEKAARRL